MSESLFPEITDPLPGPDAPRKSPGRRLTARRKAMVAAGYHPLANVVPGLRLLSPNPGRETCGGCARLQVTHRGYYKCALWPSMSASSDVRKKWPACRSFRPEAEAENITG